MLRRERGGSASGVDHGTAEEPDDSPGTRGGGIRPWMFIAGACLTVFLLTTCLRSSQPSLRKVEPNTLDDFPAARRSALQQGATVEDTESLSDEEDATREATEGSEEEETLEDGEVSEDDEQLEGKVDADDEESHEESAVVKVDAHSEENEASDGTDADAPDQSEGEADHVDDLVPAAQASWRRHPLQQEVGLPAGPEKETAVAPLLPSTVVQCETTTGPIRIIVHHSWAPLGAARFLEMVRDGFFSTRIALFRSVRNFICQTGIAGDPKVHAEWRKRGNIADDPQWLDMADDRPMKRGFLSFAGGGKNSRETQFFFSFRDVHLGESPWEVPFAEVDGAKSYEAMDHWYTGYGEMVVFHGHAPDQGKLSQQGATYIDRDFPELDFITGCDVVQENADDAPEAEIIP